MLRLETKAVTRAVHFAAYAGERAIEKISRVELHSGLRGPNLHHSPGAGFVDLRAQTHHSHSSIEHKVVIVTFAELQLLIRFVDARTDLGHFQKVERSVAHVS